MLPIGSFLSHQESTDSETSKRKIPVLFICQKYQVNFLITLLSKFKNFEWDYFSLIGTQIITIQRHMAEFSTNNYDHRGRDCSHKESEIKALLIYFEYVRKRESSGILIKLYISVNDLKLEAINHQQRLQQSQCLPFNPPLPRNLHSNTNIYICLFL